MRGFAAAVLIALLAPAGPARGALGPGHADADPAARAVPVPAAAAPAAGGGERPSPGPDPPPAPAPRWGLPEVLPASPEARDPVFAVLLGMAEADLHGVLTRDRLLAEVRRAGRPTRLPLERLHAIRRESLPAPGRARVVLTGYGPVDVPVPYDILGYHPGRFRASPRSVFEEWHLGTIALDIGRWQGEGSDRIALYRDVRIWGLVEGSVEMDVDGWLDALLGSRLDDTRVVGLALFRFEGELYGLATGYSREGRGRSGAFSFRTDELVFPSPPAFKAIGAYVRGRLERELPGIRRTRAGG